MSESCQCCCSKCPFSAHCNPEFLGHLQEIVFWRRPIPSLAVFGVINFFLLLIYKLNTGCIATCILLCALHGVSKIIIDKLGNKLSGFLFSPPIEGDAPDRTDRIRNVDEIKAFVKVYHDYIKFACDWLQEYRKNQTIVTHCIFFGSAFAVFLVATLIGTWGICFLATNTLLVLPAILCNTELHNLIKSKLQKPKTE